MENSLDKLESTPGSSIPLVKKEVEVFDDAGLIKQNEKYWTSKGAKYEKSYLMGVELGKTYLYKEEQRFNMLNGALQAILENTRLQINSDEDLSFDDKQERLVALDLQNKAILAQIEVLRNLDINVNKRHFRSILHGYVTAFLILQDYDN